MFYSRVNLARTKRKSGSWEIQEDQASISCCCYVHKDSTFIVSEILICSSVPYPGLLAERIMIYPRDLAHVLQTLMQQATRDYLDHSGKDLRVSSSSSCSPLSFLLS
uniref:Uncharacterized protein n=1 Tax=Vespula pensylvanica TaxID=30213 RepID=A0A834U9G8_VESPE|nr:hypothetical protein H0235_008783 [Vespula pensylvanica]